MYELSKGVPMVKPDADTRFVSPWKVLVDSESLYTQQPVQGVGSLSLSLAAERSTSRFKLIRRVFGVKNMSAVKRTRGAPGNTTFSHHCSNATKRLTRE